MQAASEDELRYALGLSNFTTGKGKADKDSNVRPTEVFMCSVVSTALPDHSTCLSFGHVTWLCQIFGRRHPNHQRLSHLARPYIYVVQYVSISLQCIPERGYSTICDQTYYPHALAGIRPRQQVRQVPLVAGTAHGIWRWVPVGRSVHKVSQRNLLHRVRQLE